MANDSHLRKYLEFHSLSFEQVFVSIQLKTYSKFSGWTLKLFAFELYYSFNISYTYDQKQLLG